jgi:tetratricopeptide (TPR) repeat protein
LARALVLRVGRGSGDFGEGRDAVTAAAETALKLDPRRGGAYRALAMLEPWGHHAKREKLLLQALEVAPRDPAALTDMSDFCWGVGRFRDALSYAEAACELNPLMPGRRGSTSRRCGPMSAITTRRSACSRNSTCAGRRTPGILMALLNWAGSLGYPEVD